MSILPEFFPVCRLIPDLAAAENYIALEDHSVAGQKIISQLHIPANRNQNPVSKNEIAYHTLSFESKSSSRRSIFSDIAYVNHYFAYCISEQS